jgi:hypothetical protein
MEISLSSLLGEGGRGLRALNNVTCARIEMMCQKSVYCINNRTIHTLLVPGSSILENYVILDIWRSSCLRPLFWENRLKGLKKTVFQQFRPIFLILIFLKNYATDIIPVLVAQVTNLRLDGPILLQLNTCVFSRKSFPIFFQAWCKSFICALLIASILVHSLKVKKVRW